MSSWYITILDWMVTNLKLEKAELLIYAIIYGFSNDGNSDYYGSRAELSRRINVSLRTVDCALESLVSKRLILKEIVTTNGVRYCKYRVDLQKLHTPCRNCTGAETAHNNKSISSNSISIDTDTTDTTALEASALDAREKPKTEKRFAKPTLEEVRAYCEERHNNVNPEQFVDHYESVGWRIGKNMMKDWRAAVRTWERNSKQNTAPSARKGDEPKWL